MRPNENANLLAIFAWIYAGLQSLMALLFVLYVVVFGGMGIFMALNAKNSGDAVGIALYGVMIIFFAVLAAFGAICIWANVKLGQQLRSETPPTERRVIVTAILNMVSWICGGIMLLPFGVALGVYMLWFALSEQGKAFLAGRPYMPPMMYPQPVNNYQYSVREQSTEIWKQ